MTPDVVLAEPDPHQSASWFWDAHCRRLAPELLQFVGLDADDWLQRETLCLLTDWVKELRRLLATNSPPRVFVTTIIVLAWPEDAGKGSFDNLDRFRDVVLGGANLRMKRAAYYQRGVPVRVDEFRRDLTDAGQLVAANSAAAPSPRMAAKISCVAEEEDHNAREQFYADPPFRWAPTDVAALLGKKPPRP